MLGSWLLLAASLATQAPPAGEVAVARDAVAIRRGERTYRAAIKSALYPGDRVSTGPKGVGGLYLFEGQVLYLGPGSAIDLKGSPADRVVQLDRGEVRATADGHRPLTLAAGPGRVELGRGIIRAAAADGGLRLWVEQGSAELVRPSANPLRLETGQELLIPRSGPPEGPRAATGQGWALRVQDVLLAAAADASRRLLGGRVTDINNTLARDVGPNGQLRPESTEPSTRAEVEPDESTRPGSPGGTGAPAENATTGPMEPNAPGQGSQAYQPIVLSQPNTGITASTISLALGGISASQAGGSSGGLFSDAQQDSRNPLFPGNINLVTAQTSYTLNDVRLRKSDGYPTSLQYWSVGVGPPPRTQVVTDFRTGTGPVPGTIRIPHFDAYLVRLDQYGLPNLATSNPQTSNVAALGITGLLGTTPVAPQIRGAVPLLDHGAVFNQKATFALGGLALGLSGDHPQIDLRRSDQDRQIVKSPTGNDNLDRVKLNPEVNFTAARDEKFFPNIPFVYVPAQNAPGQPTVKDAPTYGKLGLVQQAAVTTLLANALSGYARRTGQTRYVIGGNIVDITGYRKSMPKLETLMRQPLGSEHATGAAGRRHDLHPAKRR